MLDIYFDPKYGDLYEEVENGVAFTYQYENEHGKIQHMFIKREIPISLDQVIYYDLVTPYGYGGPIILEVDEENKGSLVLEYEKAFKKYCLDNNIVSEFIRFHPIIGNANEFNQIYSVNYLRNTVGTSLSGSDSPFLTEFSKSTRKTIRRSIKEGLSYRVTEGPGKLEKFMEIYYSTMDRNNAGNFYYFDEKYFEKCLEKFGEKIILTEVLYEDKIIASSINFKSGQVLHVHLSGTLSEYLHLSPAYIIKYGTLEWAIENGVELIHYGGGTSNSKEDSLYQFKKRFTKDTEFEFHIGKKIWNESVYMKLCKAQNVEEHIAFFPAYRYEENDYLESNKY